LSKKEYNRQNTYRLAFYQLIRKRVTMLAIIYDLDVGEVTNGLFDFPGNKLLTIKRDDYKEQECLVFYFNSDRIPTKEEMKRYGTVLDHQIVNGYRIFDPCRDQQYKKGKSRLFK
jgi:hypothetical protein